MRLVFLLVVCLLPWTAHASADQQPPDTDLGFSGATFVERTGPDEVRVWIGVGTRIVLEASDLSGVVVATYYSVDDGDVLVYEAPFLLTGANGPRSMTYWSVDAAGHVEPAETFLLHLDGVAPEVEIVSPRENTTYAGDGTVVADEGGTQARFAGQSATVPAPRLDSESHAVVYDCVDVGVAATEHHTRVAAVQFYVDAEPSPRATRTSAATEYAYCPSDDGEHTVTVLVYDVVGNVATESMTIIKKRLAGTGCGGDSAALVMLGECVRGPA